MKTIWKFQLGLTANQTLMMPKDAKILCAQTQNDIPQLWALVESDNTEEERFIEIYGTGHKVLEKRKYISTIQLEGGSFIYHVFEYLGT